MVDMTKLITRLETLNREATKGPWHFRHNALIHDADNDGHQTIATPETKHATGYQRKNNETCLILAAETRNALPLLIAALKVAQKAVSVTKLYDDAEAGQYEAEGIATANHEVQQAARDFAALCKQEAGG